MGSPPLPYNILALAPFAPMPDQGGKTQFVPIDPHDLDTALAQIRPILHLPMPTDLHPDGAVTLTLDRMAAFEPSVMEAGLFPSAESARSRGSDAFARPETKNGPPEKSGTMEDLFSMVDIPGPTAPESFSDPVAHGSSRLLTAIFSHPLFKAVESAWHGLGWLARQTAQAGHENTKISVASISAGCLESVLNAVQDLPAAEMPHLVLIDLGLDHTLPSLDIISTAAGFADRMLVPVCLWIRPEFFRIDHWDRIHRLAYIRNYLDGMEYAKFRKIRTLPGAEWLMLTCNSVAVRPAHDFEPSPLYTAPVWAAAALCERAVAGSGWPMGFAGPPSGPSGGLSAPGLQARISEDKALQLIEAGITPLVGTAHGQDIFIPQAPSLDGRDMGFQMFLNRVIRCLFQARENAGPKNPETALSEALIHAFTQTGHVRFDDPDVRETGSATDGARLFHIGFVPPETLMPGAGRIELTFAW